MKKLFLMVMCMVICFSFVSCISIDTPKKETASLSSTAENTKDSFGLNETAVFNELKFTAVEIKESYGESFLTPEDGNVFVGVKFSIENISDKEQAVSTLLLFEGYADDVKCDYSISAATAFADGTLDGSIAPGKKLVGWYSLEVPKNWSKIELYVQSNWLSNASAKFVFEK